MTEALAGQEELFAINDLRIIDRPIFSKNDLLRAFWEVGGSKDLATHTILSKVVAELIEFRGNSHDVKAHLEYEVNQIKEGKI